MNLSLIENLKEVRIKKGLNQRELAEKIKAKSATVSNWEQGANKPNASMIKLIANELDIHPFDLIGDFTIQDIIKLKEKKADELEYEERIALEFANDVIRDCSGRDFIKYKQSNIKLTNIKLKDIPLPPSKDFLQCKYVSETMHLIEIFLSEEKVENLFNEIKEISEYIANIEKSGKNVLLIKESIKECFLLKIIKLILSDLDDDIFFLDSKIRLKSHF